MNIFNHNLFLAESDIGIVFQVLIGAIIVITSIISSKKAAQKKKEEHERKRQQIKTTQPVSYEPPRRYQNQQTQQKFWGVKLDKVEDNNNEYIEIDDDDYDPLEPQPVRNFARRVQDETDYDDGKFGNLEKTHLKSSLENGKFQSEIELQEFIGGLSSLGELEDDENLISDDNYDDVDELNIQINIAKGSPEALVHAIVLGEIFGPPVCMREPYASKEDEEAFKKTTLL